MLSISQLKPTSKNSILRLLIFSITISFPLIVNAQTLNSWYVDKDASGSNIGTTWSNAWTSFSNINWNSIKPGDILYISGGSDSTIYNESLTIGSSGTLGSPIVITKSTDQGHSGKVIIENISTSESIIVGSKSNLTISNLYLRPQSGNGVKFDGASNVVVEKLNIRNQAAGISLQNTNGITIRNCTIISVEYSTNQTDGIYSQRNRNIRIHDNYIEVRNTADNGHNDCIQSYQDGISSAHSNENTLTVWNNTLYQNNTKTGNSSATMWTYGWGWFTAYNNLVVQPYSQVVGLGGQQNTTVGASNMKFRIWNNTHIAGTHDKPIYFRRMASTDTIDVANNLVYNTYQYSKAKIDDSPNYKVKRWNNNAYYSTNTSWSNIIMLNGSNLDMSAWQGLGFDKNSVITNSQMVNPIIGLNGLGDYSLKENSPARDAGINLQAEVEALGMPWTDINGNPRDNTPNIGAYEFSNGGIDVTPPRVTSAALINANTLRVTFSEPLALSGAENSSNYLINNGISVNSVSYSGNQATLQTTPHTNGSYTVTVNNVTDIVGNLISPANNTAQYSVQLDVTPPELVSASLIDSVRLRLTFSEVLDPATGQNINNYAISNGISVLGASLSGSQVTLSTSAHVPGNYTVTVNNVKDVVGNIISSSANTAVYEMVQNPLEGLIKLTVSSVTASVIPEPLHSPDKTIDGLGTNDSDPDSRWAGDSMPQWLVFDLGLAKQIDLLKLSFYNWENGRTYNYSVQVSTDMNQWNEIVSNASSSLSEWTDKGFTGINARYIKVLFISSNQTTWASLWEAEVFGPNSSGTDLTPPNLLSAAVLNSTTVELLFSEALETASAQTKANYSISNGIVVNSATLSSDKKKVTLNTAQHTTNQNYTVTVVNVKDIAGNIISSNNSVQYSFADNTVGNLKANAKIFLEGPFLSSNMITELSGNELISGSQPYNAAPWFYNGGESISSSSSSTVDWILVELRSAQNPAQVISRRAGLLRNDGRITELDGSLGITFNNILYGSYYIAVYHRNHLAVMTAAPVLFSPDNSLYDFTNSLSKAYGQNGMTEITAGVFGMSAGDGDGNGTVNVNDRDNVWSMQNGTLGYFDGDFNLDSGVTVKDINDYWNTNEGKQTQVP